MEKSYRKLEETVLKERQIQAASENNPYREEAINAIYRDWSEKNPSGAKAMEEKFEEEIEVKEDKLGLKTYHKYMEIAEDTGSFYPYAAAAATAKKNDLDNELYEEAVYQLGNSTNGMERQTVEKAYGIELDDIRKVLNSRKEPEGDFSNLEPEPAY